MRRPLPLPHLLAAALALTAPALALAAAPAARAGDDARVSADCARGADGELRLKGDDGKVEVELRIDTRRGGAHWSVALVHERRVAWRGSARTRSNGSLRIRRTLPDYPGADEISVRASGPRGVSCLATATLEG
ncbi:hypothetical protein VSS74_28600 [Conexibacter stalactiti]|uniref:Ig-like domain-containing protein n=1 Tax=Conexibacter stalactiti TaxID=1940611 RepID=A0ABU4HYE4_9ACTN|nr:hypothetical protein [Conexibacter stalactiti]MDW5598353.1 hypothetical protein [Conexibacter stalactiti]MEC5038995.1 hypothetical protein [Conexibacter stalactiti]